MDPFLPGEIPVMVLRYLASNKCESAALNLIEEMPLLKAYIPPKPQRVSNSDYLRHLSRSSVNPSLKDVLTDYGNAKLTVEEILDGESCIFPAFSSESLVSKIKLLQDLLKGNQSTTTVTTTLAIEPPVERKEVVNVSVAVIDQSTSTEEDYECPKCVWNRVNRKLSIESGCQTNDEVKPSISENSCQTDEYTAVQFGLHDEIPMIFYKTLLHDNNLQQKIAQTINEHMIDPQGEQNGDVVQKISSKAENEIDKFLVELLQDMPDDSNSAQGDIGLPFAGNPVPGPSSFADVHNSLSTMFQEAGIIFDTSSSNILPQGEPDKQHTPTMVKQVSTNSTISGLPPVSSPSTPELNTSNDCRKATDDSNSGLKTPKSSCRAASVKRITPTPLSCANVNPVFNTSVVVEKQTFDTGAKSANVSVITVNSEPPPWQKLNRRSIAPKIPGVKQSVQGTCTTTIINNTKDKIIWSSPTPKSSIIVQPSRMSAEKFGNSKHEVQATKNNAHLTSSHKRKTTPVKLTPEKAKNLDYNFVHVYHDLDRPPTASKIDDVSSIKTNNPSEMSATKTPVTSTTSGVESDSGVDTSTKNPCLVLVSENNSQTDSTPMQQPQPRYTASTSELKTISPNALQRLIASANKLGTVGPPINLLKKKSLSTPRKKKHIRNLTFTTPPSLKAPTPASEPETSTKDVGESSKKRKATEDLHAEFKSKKRLNWPESEKKKTKEITPNTSMSQERTAAPPAPVPISRPDPLTPIVEEAMANSSTNTTPSPDDNGAKKNRKGRVRNATTKKPPKPKIMLKVKDLFGDAPAKKRNVRSDKRSPEVIAAQAVAAQAVPLGSPRRSPRKHPVRTLQTVTEHLAPSPLQNKAPSPFENKAPLPFQTTAPSPFQNKAPNAETITLNGNVSNDAPVLTIMQSQPQHQQENVVFNIVPAPLGFTEPTPIKNFPIPPQENSIVFSLVPAPMGFPEPTPVKNFTDTGFLNLSGIGFSNNSPLITPLKAEPPVTLNETHFTLPPTPRVIDDPDSNSNSTHSLKLIYDGGMYPVNLLTSTPMKPGIPRTPGKGSSSSSNSRSPPSVMNVKPDGERQKTQTSQVIPPPSPRQQAAKINSTTATTCDLSSSKETDKSDGELSSSDDENEGSNTATQRPVQNVAPIRQPPLSAKKPAPQGCRSTASASVVQPRHNQSLSSRPQISVSLNSNLKQTHGINFQVGGRGKVLTMSEQETLYSLLHIGGANLMPGSGRNDNTTMSAIAPVLHPQRPINEPRNSPSLLRNSKGNVGHLIKFIHRRFPQPPKNN